MSGTWKNRASNAVATPVRMGLGAPVHATVDLGKTVIGVSKDSYDIAMETVNEIQETLSEAGKRGKWYHKAANIGVIAPLGSAAKVITGGIQSVVNPIVNGVFNGAKTGWAFLKNEFNSLKSVFSKNPMSDFSFEKLKLTPTWKSRWNPKNLLLGGAAASTAVAVATSPDTSSTSTPAAQSTQQQKPLQDEQSKKIIADLQSQVQEQAKINQTLQQQIIDTRKDMQMLQKNNAELLAKPNQQQVLTKEQYTDPKDSGEENLKKKSFEKSATKLKSHIDTIIPQGYTTRIDTVGENQRIVVTDPEQKENVAKPTFYLTPTLDNTINIHYSPLDSHGEFYYHGSFDVQDRESIDACISLVISAMQGNNPDIDTFTADLSAIGLEKKITKKDKEPADVMKKNTKNTKKKPQTVSV